MIKRIAVGALVTTSAFAQSQAVEEKMKAEAQHSMTVYSIDSAQVSTLTGAPYSAGRNEYDDADSVRR